MNKHEFDADYLKKLDTMYDQEEQLKNQINKLITDLDILKIDIKFCETALLYKRAKNDILK